MFCRFCGATLPDDSTFCQSCGKPLATGSTASVGASAAPGPALAPTPTASHIHSKRPWMLIGGIAIVFVLAVVAAVVVMKSGSNTGQPPNQQVSAQPLPANPKPSAAQPPTEVSTEDLFKQASPSVVLIEVFNGSGERNGTGSGFVAADGTIVTNYHVIRGAHSANVHLQDGSTLPCQGISGFDQYRDVAVLKVQNLSAKPLTLADSEKLQIGDRVIAIGSPLAIQNTLSDGIVSGIRNGLIQTSTPISPGSSGGPLFNKHGEVVGITVAQVMGAQNINFAVPINWAKSYLHNSELTALDDLARQNTVEEQIVSSTISVPAHERRAFTIAVDRNRMSDAELDGTFSSSGGLGGQVRVFLAMQNNIVYDSGRTANGTVHVPLHPGIYQLVIDNTGSAMFPRSVTADFRFHYAK